MKIILTPATRLTLLVAIGTLAGCLSSGGGDETSGFSETPTPPGNPPGNSAPTISGNPPAAVAVDETYSFTPSASDVDGDALTFSIQNMPQWAGFDTMSGGMTGTPAMGDIGTYPNIQISVSDGEVSAAMDAFSVEVTQVATRSASLSWTAPTANEDGSNLSDLAGYKIYYGTSSGSYSNTIRIDNPSITTYVVENLSPNTYFFAATAFNTAGVESSYSGEASKTLN